MKQAWHSKQGFTLIELLVVVAIIALLMSIVVPAMRKAKDVARKVVCQTQFKQIGVILGTYEAQTGYNFRNYPSATAMNMSRAEQRQTRHWFWYNGTSDNAHEEMPFVFENLTYAGLLTDRKILFCPGINNLAHDRNYVYSLVGQGDYTPHDTEDIIRQYGMRRVRASAEDGPLFWSTHTWVWKKEIRENITSINNASNGAMMVDMTSGIWNHAANTNTTFRNFFDAVGVSRAFQHSNVLMHDLSVNNPTDKDEELYEWLWNSDRWAGSGY